MRADLGTAFAERRNALLDEGCGSEAQVRTIVEEARSEGLLDED